MIEPYHPIADCRMAISAEVIKQTPPLAFPVMSKVTVFDIYSPKYLIDISKGPPPLCIPTIAVWGTLNWYQKSTLDMQEMNKVNLDKPKATGRKVGPGVGAQPVTP
uniref:Uncharacterized protein n=1 Tax=Sphaerodactylus townsendi TaxID=933632 RepID=A0ACB8EZJ4_9SAUR